MRCLGLGLSFQVAVSDCRNRMMKQTKSHITSRLKKEKVPAKLRCAGRTKAQDRKTRNDKEEKIP